MLSESTALLGIPVVVSEHFFSAWEHLSSLRSDFDLYPLISEKSQAESLYYLR